MSIATESLSRDTTYILKRVEDDARRIAKEHGVKIRRNEFSGIDVKFPSGEKKKFWGWIELRNVLAASFDLLD